MVKMSIGRLFITNKVLLAAPTPGGDIAAKNYIYHPCIVLQLVITTSHYKLFHTYFLHYPPSNRSSLFLAVFYGISKMYAPIQS